MLILVFLHIPTQTPHLNPSFNCPPLSHIPFIFLNFTVLCPNIVPLFLSSCSLSPPPPTDFPNFYICLCLVWECPCFMHLALTCTRLLVKQRQPCSTGRCLKTCAALRHTAKTPLRLLQLVLLRPPLKA